MSNFNLPAVLFSLAAWGLIIFSAVFIYRRKEIKLKKWKIIFVMLIGLFSFSFKMHFYAVLIQISILPLGVWILFGVLRRKEGRWQTYRPYAWLGFAANFIFLISSILSISVHHMLFPRDEASTYVSNIHSPSVIVIHPSGKEEMVDSKKLQTAVENMEEKELNIFNWHDQTVSLDRTQMVETFPYVLKGTSSKWGSGIETLVYVEKDGKGILITSKEKQHYFRSPDSIFEGVDEE
ncbi:hypothetical protein [Falsibacillus pallidus]|uniref:hypothetical protein n=1 Tax=Falsibacillus pallidus TaxID=493781 RepID=UPI003D955438